MYCKSSWLLSLHPGYPKRVCDNNYLKQNHDGKMKYFQIFNDHNLQVGILELFVGFVVVVVVGAKNCFNFYNQEVRGIMGACNI